MKHCYMCIFKDHCCMLTHKCDMKYNDEYLLADSIAVLKNDIRQTIIDIKNHEDCDNENIDRMVSSIDYICDKLISDEFTKKFTQDSSISHNDEIPKIFSEDCCENCKKFITNECHGGYNTGDTCCSEYVGYYKEDE